MIHTPTANGAVAFKSTGSNCLNLFFNIGASRNNSNIFEEFGDAYLENPQIALSILMYSRDIRQGLGERNTFRKIINKFSEIDESFAKIVINEIPKIGRFDDLLSLYDTKYESLALSIWANSLREGNRLAFKWTDRSDKKLRNFMGFKNEAEFRKFISNDRKDSVVEQKMCSNHWYEIEYNKLPSVAGIRYAKAFKKNDGERYERFIKNNETKVNASTLFPHDVYRLFKYGDDIDSATKYWNNLPKIENFKNTLVVADVSGSMDCTCSGKITCMDVSVSLGTYLSQQIKGSFNNKLITFSETPSLVEIPKSSNLSDIFRFVQNIQWGGSTNIERVFKLILNFAVSNSVPQNEFPDYILILSDMQFNPLQSRITETTYKHIKELYTKNNYKLPTIIFWNLNAGYKNYPVTKGEYDTILLSGFSPNILKAVIQGEIPSSEEIMFNAIKKYLELF